MALPNYNANVVRKGENNEDWERNSRKVSIRWPVQRVYRTLREARHHTYQTAAQQVPQQKGQTV